VEKADLSEGYQNPERKYGVTMHFSEIIDLKFGKDISIHSLYFDTFLELCLLNYLCKMRGYPYFSLWIPTTLAKLYPFLIVITFAKIHLYWEAPSLSLYTIPLVQARS